MDLQKMYPPQKDSPSTYITGEIGTEDVYINVGSAEILPQEAPFPLTLGFDKSITETVIVTVLDSDHNQLTVQRGDAPLSWPAGTKCARVWTSEDVSAIQNNIHNIGEQTEENTSDIADETERAMGVEDGLSADIADETERAMGVEDGLSANKVNRSELTTLITDVNYTANGTAVSVTFTTYNASAKNVDQFIRYFPVVSNAAMGIMTPEAYAELIQLRTDVYALQQQGGRFIGISFASVSDLEDYVVPSSVNVGDFTYVLDDEEHSDATTRYVYDGENFEFAYVINFDPVGLANGTTPGLVLSDDGTTGGKIFVEADGTMSVVEWDYVLQYLSNLDVIIEKVSKLEEIVEILTTEGVSYQDLQDSEETCILDDNNNGIQGQIIFVTR
jgi:hypothetical protein